MKIVRYITVCRQCTLTHCNGECEHEDDCSCWSLMPYAHGDFPCGDVACDTVLPDPPDAVTCAACGNETDEGLSRFAVFREPPKWIVSVWPSLSGENGYAQPARSVKDALRYARSFRKGLGIPLVSGMLSSVDHEILYILKTGPKGGLFWETLDGTRRCQ
jgi:hypothetical protein